MNKKILAVDLDGTLFDDNKGISKENLKALNLMLDQDHILAVDTGRPIHVLTKILDEFDVFKRENVYLLGYQGTVGVRSCDGAIIYKQFLDTNEAIKLINYARSANISTVAFELGKIYSFSNDYNVQNYAKHSKEKITIINSTEYLRNHDLTKVMLIDYNEHNKLHDFQNEHDFEMSKSFSSMFSSVDFLEYIGIGSDKGEGLRCIAEFLNIPMEDTVACGDERNDISMIVAAGVGVCVSNGRDELKSVADYITTEDNNHGAIAEAINKFILKP